MFWTPWTTALFVIAAAAIFWLWPIVSRALKRFDDENRARIEGQLRDRWDRQAHFRQTIDVAQEQVEEIVEILDADPRTGTPVKRYVFEGVWYATRDEAEQVRAQKVGDIARGFYRDLPAALAARKNDGKLGN